MTSANVLDTKDCRTILQDMADAVVPPRAFAPMSLPRSRAAEVPRVQIFKAAGIYTVVLAQDPREIPAALSGVPAAKRPAPNPALFEAYAQWYPGWTVALCCFKNRRAKLANPMLWWYQPMNPDQLFLPALDCHTGDVPDLENEVRLEHIIVVGSDQMDRSPDGGLPAADRHICPVRYRDTIPESVRPYLLSHMIGQGFWKSMRNGDFVCDLDHVRRGEFRPIRKAPGSVAGVLGV
jgi:hypothetical protein